MTVMTKDGRPWDFPPGSPGRKKDIPPPPTEALSRTKRKPREWDVENWAKQYARDTGWWVRKFTSPAQRAVPDDIFLKKGRVFWVEFKAPGQVPTKAQEMEHDVIREHGGTVYICNGREQFVEIIESEEALL